MDTKTKGILATVASVVLCGCPGLFLCIMGIGTATGNGTYTLGTESGSMPATYGFVFLCLALIFMLIPIVVGFMSFRKKPAAMPSNEQVPPAS
jgi:hypothetical protein